MKVIILIAILTLVCSNPLQKNMMKFISEKPPKEQFKLWHFSYQRPYDVNTTIGLHKYKIFKQNLKMYEEHNSKNLGFTVGLGPFSDITFEEAKESFLKDIPQNFMVPQTLDFDTLADEDENDIHDISQKKLTDFESPDWSYLYKETKSQGDCGSCWIFAAVGFIEGHLSKSKNNQQIRLSEQYLLDCIRVDWCTEWTGCSGGTDSFALDKIIELGGIYKESEYTPYNAVAGVCKESSECKKKYLKLTSYKQCGNTHKYNPVCPESEYRTYTKEGPYSAALHVGALFIHYTEGIYSDSNFCEWPNHAIVVVQYKVKKEDKIFKIRNSWGPFWGVNGYGYVAIKKGQAGYVHGCNLQSSSAHNPVFEVSETE